jgi:hypothetical protein
MKKLYFNSRCKSIEKLQVSPGWFSKTRSLSIIILLLFTLGFSQAVWGEEDGDYGSLGSGEWTESSNWGVWNGTGYVSNGTYPGEETDGDYTVTIQVGHTITISSSYTFCFGDLIVYGQLTLNNINNSLTLTCTDFVLVNGGTILWNSNNVTFTLPANAVLDVENYDGSNGLQAKSCNNTQRLVIGSIEYGACSGQGNVSYLFSEINERGGILKAIASAEPDTICVGETITLLGDTAGYYEGTLTYKWEVDGPEGQSIISTDQDPGDITLNTAGVYIYTFTVTDTREGFTYSTADEVQVVVMPNSLTWDGSVDGYWNTAGNWFNTNPPSDPDPDPDNDYYVPIACTDVIIPDVSSLSNFPEVDVNTTDAACKSLTINDKGQLTVNGTLTTNGNVTINSTSDVANGSLIVNGILTLPNGGTVTYNRYIHPSRWWIVSSPVAGSNLEDFSSKISTYDDGSSETYDFAPYDEFNNNGWVYETYSETIDLELIPGKGYLIGTKSSDVTYPGIIPFTGTLNGDIDGYVDVTIKSTGERDGWNAVGNPYTSAIGITSGASSDANFLNVNSDILETDYAAIYVWNQTASYENNEQYYKAISNNGYNPYSYPGMGTLPDDHIQAGQGFLINAIYDSGADGKISFTKTMQTHDTGLSLKSAKTSWPGVTLLAENGDQSRYTIVAFNEQMTTGLDKTYDAGLLASSDFILYSRLVSGDEGVDFEIQCLPDNMYSELSVPIGLDLPKAGTVTFKAAGIILPNGIFPVLEDRLLQVTTPLKTEGDSYTVDIEDAVEGTGRFYMIFTNTVSAKETAQPESFKAWFANDKIVLDGYAEEGTKVSLFDISGRKLGIYPLMQMNRNEIPASTLSPGIYLLRIEGREQQQEIKIPIAY